MLSEARSDIENPGLDNMQSTAKSDGLYDADEFTELERHSESDSSGSDEIPHKPPPPGQTHSTKKKRKPTKTNPSKALSDAGFLAQEKPTKTKPSKTPPTTSSQAEEQVTRPEPSKELADAGSSARENVTEINCSQEFPDTDLPSAPAQNTAGRQKRSSVIPHREMILALAAERERRSTTAVKTAESNAVGSTSTNTSRYNNGKGPRKNSPPPDDEFVPEGGVDEADDLAPAKRSKRGRPSKKDKIATASEEENLRQTRRATRAREEAQAQRTEPEQNEDATDDQPPNENEDDDIEVDDLAPAKRSKRGRPSKNDKAATASEEENQPQRRRAIPARTGAAQNPGPEQIEGTLHDQPSNEEQDEDNNHVDADDEAPTSPIDPNRMAQNLTTLISAVFQLAHSFQQYAQQNHSTHKAARNLVNASMHSVCESYSRKRKAEPVDGDEKQEEEDREEDVDERPSVKKRKGGRSSEGDKGVAKGAGKGKGGRQSK